MDIHAADVHVMCIVYQVKSVGRLTVWPGITLSLLSHYLMNNQAVCSLLPPSPVCGCSPAAGGSTGSQMAGEWSTGWCCRRCSPSPPSPCRAAGPPCQPRPRGPLWAHSVGPGWPPSPSQTDPSHSNFSRTRVRPHPPRCRLQTERSLWSDSSAAYEPERWYLEGQDDSVLKISVDSQRNA